MQSTPTPSNKAVVNAVLFYSPGCSHCRYVIQEALPPILKEFGDQLNIIGVDASQPDGQMLFQAAIKRFNMESGPVPTLIVGDTVLMGSVDIPKKLPDLVKKHLAQGGVGWPDIPGLEEALFAAQAAQAQTAAPLSTQTTPAPASTMPAFAKTVAPGSTPTVAGIILANEVDDSVWGRISRDPIGNTLSIIVLMGMAASVIAAFFYFRRPLEKPIDRSWDWAIPTVCILGLGIAAYLAYVETASVTAVCGPVGDCNTVQQSEYARLFGVLHIGVLGVLGYALIIVSWCIGRFAKERLASCARLAVLGMAAFGTLFSIYLTFLEPFVIGATCAWCLTSAILMTALLWLSILPGKLALSSLIGKSKNQPVLGEKKTSR